MPPPVGARVRCIEEGSRYRGRVGVVERWAPTFEFDQKNNAGSDDGPYGGVCWVDFGDLHPDGSKALYCAYPEDVIELGDTDDGMGDR